MRSRSTNRNHESHEWDRAGRGGRPTRFSERRDERNYGGDEVPERMTINTGRRWLRISIRGLMALVLIVACALGWIVSRARVQRNAVAAVRNAGGTVMYDFEHAPGFEPPARLAGWRGLIADAIGGDFVSSVTLVSMPRRSGAYSQNILARLGVFEQLEYVDLRGPSVGDDQIASLRNMTRLRLIVLQQTDVTDAGLAHFKGLVSLEQLILSSCEVTDDGLLHLKSLAKLEFLVLERTRVTDAGLRHLRALPNLKTLAIEGSGLTDCAIPELKRLVGLRLLTVSETEISAAGIEELKNALPNTTVTR
jgi:internalin A